MYNHTATIVDENGVMLIFGGYPNYQGAYSLDLTDMNWSWKNNAQYKRAGHTANLIGNSIYLFGGFDNDEVDCNDLHKYDIK